MPQIPVGMIGVRYSRPYGWGLFAKDSRIVDLFGASDYYTDELKRFSDKEFSVEKIFDQYMAEVSSKYC